MAEKLELGDHIKNNPLLIKSFLLALEIIKLYKSLTEEKYEVQDQRPKAEIRKQKLEIRKQKLESRKRRN